MDAIRALGYNVLRMTSNPLAGFEDRIQQLVEGGLARLFAGRLHPREVAVQLARAMEDHAVPGDYGLGIAPDTFLTRLNPRDHQAILEASPDIITVLEQELIDLARRSNLAMLTLPTVKLLADASVELHHVAITARHSAENREATESMGPDVVWGAKNFEAPTAALMLQSDRSVPLDRPVINLGRYRDNQIVIDNPHVSRHHAQIRLRAGHFILFDLGSKAGTTVNGQPIHEVILRSGDVIGLAGTNVIYVEDAALPPAETEDQSDTRPLG